jgi:hypothetical protein
MTKKNKKAAEQTVLAALAVGATVENAARKAGMCERTVYRWLADPAFQARLNQTRFDTFMRAGGMLTGASLGSVKTLVDLQQDGSVPAAVRRRAARDVVELSLKYRESAGMEQRVTALEDRLADAH